jgi:hypothetical protein
MSAPPCTFIHQEPLVKKQIALAVAGLAFAAACESSSPTGSTMAPTDPSNSAGLVGQPEPPMLGAHWGRGNNPGHAAGAAGALYGNMTLHGGNVMPSNATYAIYWGPGWATNPGDKIAGINAFYAGFGGSNYAHTNTEYNGVDGAFAGVASTFLGSTVDNSTAPRRAPSTSTVQSEVCKVLSAKGITPRSDALYNVYATTTRGSAGYCAWHSYGSCNGTNIQFAWYFNLDGDAGCDPGSPTGSYTAGHVNSQGLNALSSVAAHELSETITDPRNGGWYDAGNGENGDKCAWAFSPNNGGLVTLSNGATFKMQMEWSNREFTAGTGYANRDGQKGCLDGVVKF